MHREQVIAFAPSGTDPDEREFLREARAWCAWHEAQGRGAELVTFDPDAPELVRRRRVLDAIDAAPATLVHVAFFCHGLRGSIQAGFARPTVRLLAEALEDAGADDGTHVSLYCCSTGGESPNAPSFASMLRSAMVDAGFGGGIVLAHTNAGHTTRNRAVRLLPITRRPTDPAGAAAWDAPLVIAPSERDDWRRFRAWLAPDTVHRWRLGTMTREQVRAEVCSRGAP